jgi:hypothetical protein
VTLVVLVVSDALPGSALILPLAQIEVVVANQAVSLIENRAVLVRLNALALVCRERSQVVSLTRMCLKLKFLPAPLR